jgi:hypothetical protein
MALFRRTVRQVTELQSPCRRPQPRTCKDDPQLIQLGTCAGRAPAARGTRHALRYRSRSRPTYRCFRDGAIGGAASCAGSARGVRAHVPDVLHGQGTPPAWSAWSTHLTGLLSLEGKRPVLVGYSASTTLAAELATKMPTQGIVFLDGDIPPRTGRVLPGSERVRRRVEALDDHDGRLPPWSDWFTTDEERAIIGIAALQTDTKAWDSFKLDQPRMTRDWFVTRSISHPGATWRLDMCSYPGFSIGARQRQRSAVGPWCG